MASSLCWQSLWWAEQSSLRVLIGGWQPGISPQAHRGNPPFPCASGFSLEISQPEFLLLISFAICRLMSLVAFTLLGVPIRAQSPKCLGKINMQKTLCPQGHRLCLSKLDPEIVQYCVMSSQRMILDRELQNSKSEVYLYISGLYFICYYLYLTTWLKNKDVKIHFNREGE